MVIEIVDLPIKNGDVPWFFVCLPERIIVIVVEICHAADVPQLSRRSHGIPRRFPLTP